MSLPLISVIVPVYNVEEYLLICLDSLQKQTYENLEIILVDDGSTDSSSEIVDECARIDKRVKVFHTKNGGLSAARNFGLKKATGEYVMFVDSDDFLKKEAVQYLYELIEKSGAKISVASHIEKRGEKQRDFNDGKVKINGMTVEEALYNMLNERGFMVSAWGKLYAGELFKGIKFPDGKLHEDVGTTYRVFLAAYDRDQNAKIAYGAKSIYIYNIRSSSITNAGFDSRKMELITQTDEMCDEIDSVFPGLNNTTNLRRMHARFSILRQIESGNKLEGELIKYIKEHKDWIRKNPEAGKRDKMALRTLLIGKWAFDLSWKIYKKLDASTLDKS